MISPFWHAAPERAEDEISDPGEIVLFPRSDADCQAFLVSQMRLNDELAKALFHGRRTVNQRGYGADWPKRRALKSLSLWQ